MHSFEVRSGGTDVGLTLRVPNEKDNASTVTVRVSLPLGTPLIGVLVRPLAGWAATVTTAKLAKPVKTDDGTITEAASQITWTGGRIGPGQYQDFDFEVSQLPVAKELEFKVLQTYSDGDVVRWIDFTTTGPEHPAATLSLSGDGGAGNPGPAASISAPGPSDRVSTSSVHVATGLAIAGSLGAAAAGLLAGLALRRRRAA